MLHCKPLPPLCRIRHLLALRKDGILIWKRPTSNRVRPGQVAGRWNKGYRVVNIDGHSYGIHRIVWALSNGMDPGDLEIDHKNGNPSDNRPCNLRACTRQQNTLNVKMRSDNTSGARGVSFDPSSIKNPWRAYIRSKRLGRFPSREAAMDALLKAVRCDQDLAFYYKEKTD